MSTFGAKANITIAVVISANDPKRVLLTKSVVRVEDSLADPARDLVGEVG